MTHRIVVQAEAESSMDGGAGALRRGLHILNILRDLAPLRPGEIAQRTGIPRPTVYRLLEVLEAERYVLREPDGKSFSLQQDTGTADRRWEDYVQRMKPVILDIARRTGNAVFLARQDDNDLLCLHREIGTYPVQILSLPVGGRQVLGVGAAGVALASMMEDRELAQRLEANRDAYRQYGSLNARTVRQLVDNCRARGYSVVGNYSLKGVLAVGFGIPGGRGSLRSAISVTASVDRMTLQHQREVAMVVRAALDVTLRQAGPPLR